MMSMMRRDTTDYRMVREYSVSRMRQTGQGVRAKC